MPQGRTELRQLGLRITCARLVGGQEFGVKPAVRPAIIRLCSGNAGRRQPAPGASSRLARLSISGYANHAAKEAALLGGIVTGETDCFLREILSGVKTIAVVGASDKEHRPSFGVFKFLLAHGYDVAGVNPNCAGNKLHGKMVYRSLSEVPGPVDMVDIFRNPKAAGDAVREALALDPKPKVIWMQLGVRNEEAARHARAAGVKVVMDRCPAIEIRRLGIPRHQSLSEASALSACMESCKR